MLISGSVGREGRNLPVDVRYVQSLLNYVRQERRLPDIGVDGLVGPETIGAIEAYQRERHGAVDGRVDPDGPTLAALEAAFATYKRQLKAYAVLAMVLSYDPVSERPRFDAQAAATMLRAAAPAKAG